MYVNFFWEEQAQGVYEQYQNNMPQIEDGNQDMEESDSVVGEDGESEKTIQPELVDGTSTEMEVDNGVSGENGKADEN